MIKSQKPQLGFSMIEVLVSLVIIGIGMLGLSGLQVASMKGTTNAHSRNVASMLAFELGERMRANIPGVEGGFYNNDVNCTVKEKQCRNKTTYCSAQETARFDVQDVLCGTYKSATIPREGGIANLLSGGTLQVSCPDGCSSAPTASRNLHNVTITWGETNVHKDQAGSSTTQTITVPIIP